MKPNEPARELSAAEAWAAKEARALERDVLDREAEEKARIEDVREGRKALERVSIAASLASEKVRAKAERIWLPRSIDLATDDDAASLARRLRDLMVKNDFYSLVENPNNPDFNDAYKGWTPDEIRELYEVLYGEEMAD